MSKRKCQKENVKNDIKRKCQIITVNNMISKCVNKEHKKFEHIIELNKKDNVVKKKIKPQYVKTNQMIEPDAIPYFIFMSVPVRVCVSEQTIKSNAELRKKTFVKAQVQTMIDNVRVIPVYEFIHRVHKYIQEYEDRVGDLYDTYDNTDHGEKKQKHLMLL